MTDPHPRDGSARSRRIAGNGRILVVAAGVLLIVLASASLAFLLGGGLRDAGTGPSPSLAVVAPGSTSPGSSEPSAQGTATASTTPDASDPDASDPAVTATPGAVTGVGIRAKRIRIDRLGIDQRIVEGDGLDAPIGKAAHYPSSGWPGGGTNTYIYGHARKGMFLSLWDAREGDVVVLDLVDGTSRSYVVTRVLPTVPWDALEYTEPTPTEQLTLQTSTSYTATAPRFIVIAVPQS